MKKPKQSSPPLAEGQPWKTHERAELDKEAERLASEMEGLAGEAPARVA